MKVLTIALLTLALSPALGFAQEIPPAPTPAQDPAWSRLESLRNGQAIVVTTVDNPSVHCLFAGVTDAYLFCNPPGNPRDTGFRFDRSEVVSVDLDWQSQAPVHASRSEHHYHPAWISSMIAGGIFVGLCARNTDAGTAVKAGLIGAGIVGLIGAPFAFLPNSQAALSNPVYPQYGIGLPIKLKVPQHIRRIPIFRTLH